MKQLAYLATILAAVQLASAVNIGDHRIFDTHVHISFDDATNPVENQLNSFLKSFSGRAFLLSGAYHIDPRIPEWGDSSTRTEINRKTSLVVQKYSDRFWGLCGLNYMWPDSDLNLSECLNMPGMIGAKIRLVQYGTSFLDQFSEQQIRENVRQAIFINRSKLKVVLIHLTNEAHWAKLAGKDEAKALARDIESLNKFLDLVEEFPNVQFILAHSLYSPDLFRAMIARLNNKAPDNLWMDLSHILVSVDSKTDKETIISLATNFNLNHVLYGSDVDIGGSNFGKGMKMVPIETAISDSLTLFEDFNGLRDTEKQKILIHNGERLLLKLGIH